MADEQRDERPAQRPPASLLADEVWQSWKSKGDKTPEEWLADQRRAAARANAWNVFWALVLCAAVFAFFWYLMT